jgi:hypothetical protein
MRYGNILKKHIPAGGLPPSALSGKWAIEVFYKKEKS